MSYFEIYNEKVFDLMDPQGVDPLEVRESRSKQFFIQGLTERLIPDIGAAKQSYEQGEAKRRYSVTSMNHNSSRSHVILQIKIESRFYSTPTKTYTSVLTMADLAGSENIQKSKTTGVG